MFHKLAVLSFPLTLLLASVASGAPAAEAQSGPDTGGRGIHTGWFTFTCQCSNPSTKTTSSMSPLCEQAGGKVSGNTCQFQTDNDLKVPTIFTNDNCVALYGASYKGSCSMDGFYSICPGLGGCPLPLPTQKSDCAMAPNQSTFFCFTNPMCVKGQLRCDWGAMGYCIWGTCQCGTQGWTITKESDQGDCSNLHTSLR